MGFVVGKGRVASKFARSRTFTSTLIIFEIGFFTPNVSPFGFVRDQGKESWSLTKPKGKTLGVKN